MSVPAIPTQPTYEPCSPVSPVPLVWEGLPLQGDLARSPAGQWLCQGDPVPTLHPCLCSPAFLLGPGQPGLRSLSFVKHSLPLPHESFSK